MNNHFIKKILLTASILLTTSSSSFASNFDFLKLKVFKDVKQGLWSAKFSTVPKHPTVPNREETACLDKQQMANQLKDSMKQGSQPCEIKNVVDGATSSKMTMVCPPMEIPQLKIKAPGSSMPLTIVKNSEVKWTVQVEVPSVPGVSPKANWIHEYTWLKACDKK